MRQVTTALVLSLSLAAAGLAGEPEGRAATTVATKRVVVHATWRVGIPAGRFTRQEWYEVATGKTRRQDAGGAVCRRTTIADSRRIASIDCERRSWRVVRVRGAADPRLLWQTSDLLRPRRLLRLGQANAIGPVKVGGRDAIRVQLPVSRRFGEGPYDAAHFADVEPVRGLPLQFTVRTSGSDVPGRPANEVHVAQPAACGLL
jgi:hypothetical protein